MNRPPDDPPNIWGEDQETKILGPNFRHSENIEVDDMLKNYIIGGVIEDVLLDYLNPKSRQPSQNHEQTIEDQTEINIKVENLKTNLKTLQSGIDGLSKRLDFDFGLIAKEKLVNTDQDFVAKYMYTLQLLDSLDDKVREDFLFLKKKIQLLNVGSRLKREGEVGNMRRLLVRIEDQINHIARQHISIGVRVMECITLRSEQDIKYKNIKTYVELDHGCIGKKRETLSMGKVSSTIGARTTERFIIYNAEDEDKIEMCTSLGERPTKQLKRIRVNQDLNPNDISISANKSGEHDKVTRKIEQFSLKELSA